MTTGGEPTLGEVLRRLEEVVRQLTDISSQMKADRVEASNTYVRKDVYGAEYTSHERRLKDLEDENQTREKQAADTRRQFIFLVLSLAIPVIASLLLSVNQYLASGGK